MRTTNEKQARDFLIEPCVKEMYADKEKQVPPSQLR